MPLSSLLKDGEVEINPRVKDILLLLAGGAILGAFIIFPGLPLAFSSHIKSAQKKSSRESAQAWEKYSLRGLRLNLKRLKKQKMVKIEERDGLPVVVLTQKGKTRVLKYKLEALSFGKSKNWDGQWRLIIYDVPTRKKALANAFRYMLKKIKCLKLQKSVYLTPYPCEEEIEYLRHAFLIGDHVVLLNVSKIENEEVYRRYFGL